MAERIQKLISAAGLASRRNAEQMILDGRVLVNGKTAVLGQRAEPETDRIEVDGAALSFSTDLVYIMLNKPRGYVTTMRDERGRPTVKDLVQNVGTRVYPVGRLDYDSDGLLLLTNDGAFAQAMTHPSHAVDKVYRTEVSGDVAAALPVLTGPIGIDGRTVIASSVTQEGRSTLYITIHEGRNRQIRKMCAAAGLRVRRLTRVSEGPLRLGSLSSGAWRYLSKNEISAAKNLIYRGETRDK